MPKFRGARGKYSSFTTTLEEVTIRPSTSISYAPFELRARPRNAPVQPRSLKLGLCCIAAAAAAAKAQAAARAAKAAKAARAASVLAGSGNHTA